MGDEPGGNLHDAGAEHRPGLHEPRQHSRGRRRWLLAPDGGDLLHRAETTAGRALADTNADRDGNTHCPRADADQDRDENHADGDRDKGPANANGDERRHNPIARPL